MINVYKVLGNYFNKNDMSKVHLLSFGKDHLQRLTNSNSTNKYTTIIAFLTPLVAALATEIGNEDTSINIRKAKTDTVIETVSDFSHTMSDLEGVIANSLGGRNTEAYKEFYPNGLTEYSKPNKDNMVLYLGRISKAATKYTTQIGAIVTAKLLGLDTFYSTARTSQSTAVSDVANAKSDIVNNRANLEIGLNKSIHEIGMLYPGNVLPCIPLFNFNLLYSITHHPHDVHSGTIAVNGMVEIINRTLTDIITIEVRNTGTNAAIWIWLGATATDTNNAMAIKIEPAHATTIKPSDVGDLANTFLLVKNESSINVASYEITIIG